MIKKAVVLLSGGMDSLTCMAIAQSEGYELFPISFDYGQKQRSELNAAKNIAEQFNATHRIINIQDLGKMGGSAITDQSIDIEDYKGDGEIPATYVPGRNLIFFSIATGYAEILEADCIYTGVSSVDYSGYPDCRPEFIDSFRQTANLATKVGVEGQGIELKTPLIYLSKAQTIQRGLDLGVDYCASVTCYRADDNGLACGECDSCVLRKQGFEELGVADQTRYCKLITSSSSERRPHRVRRRRRSATR